MSRLLVAIVIAGCGVEPTPGNTAAAPADVLDARATVPPASPDYYDIITPEQRIEPGEDKMLCLHVRIDRELAVDTFVGLQGKAAHHMALFTTTEPKPDGTLEDCTSPDSNRPLKWFINGLALPAGKAIRVPADTHLVMQFHYINSWDIPMLVRDIGRIHLVPDASVDQWVASLTAQHFGLQLPPGRSSLSWECTIPRDGDLLAILGHMHESGARVTLALDDVPVYEVAQWTPAMREGPPVTYFYDEPLHLSAGTRFRTTCEWDNRTNTTLGYPAEMCLAFAYFGGGQEPFECLPDQP